MSLTAAEIAAMRDDLEDSMPDTCVIQRRSLTTDGQGGKTEAWAAAGTVVCRLSPQGIGRGDETSRAERISGEEEWVVTLPALSDVTTTDRLVVLGVTYEPVGLRAVRSWELSRRVTCKRIT